MKQTVPVTFEGTGVSVPEEVLTSDELDTRLGLPAGESFRVTGVRRRHVTKNETASELAAAAVRSALADASVSWQEVDCLVCASATMDQALPYNAAMVLAELQEDNGHRIATVDIGASCLSFLQAVDLMSSSLTMERYDTVVIVSCDISTFTTDLSNLGENGIFGDGAAAAVMRRATPGESSAIIASRSLTLPEGIDFCRIQSGGTRFHRRDRPEHTEALFEMRGRPLYALVARELPGFVESLLEEAEVRVEDLSLLIPHQASRQALNHVTKMLKFESDQVSDVFSEFGNQVSASLPTALHFAIHRHGLKRGDKALLLGSGAGVTIGGIVFTY